MARPQPSSRIPPRRDRPRELLTFAVAFAFAFVVGRLIVQMLDRPSGLVQIVIFIVLYVLAYIALWRLGARLRR